MKLSSLAHSCSPQHLRTGAHKQGVSLHLHAASPVRAAVGGGVAPRRTCVWLTPTLSACICTAPVWSTAAQRSAFVLVDASARRGARSDVDYIIHCAASIRFDLPVKAVLRANFLPTRALLEFACALPGLRAFTFMSTAYANAHLPQARARAPPAGSPVYERNFTLLSWACMCHLPLGRGRSGGVCAGVQCGCSEGGCRSVWQER